MSDEFSNTDLTIAQFSDCHLFADTNALHHGANVYQNLTLVLADLAKDKTLHAIIFTGDLSQDHSEQSYKNFVVAIEQSQILVPIYYLAGNHDEYSLLRKYLNKIPFTSSTTLENSYWQVLLVNSKSDTPSGVITPKTLKGIDEKINENKNQLLFSHHHPIDVGYFIDRHGLQNQQQFWQTISKYQSIKGLACGHVHRALTLTKQITQHEIHIFTCPATSIQFDPTADTVKALPISSENIIEQGIGYRRFTVQANGNLLTSLHFSNSTPISPKE